jgi:hypothetical protein
LTPARGENHPPGAHFQRHPSHIQEPSIQKRASFGRGGTISTRAGGGGAETSTKSASGGGTGGGSGSEPHPKLHKLATLQDPRILAGSGRWGLQLTRVTGARSVPRNEGCKLGRFVASPRSFDEPTR